MKDQSKRRAKEIPHAYDVFLMDTILNPHMQDSELAVCWPTENYGGDLVWRTSQEDYFSLDPPFHVRRVASLSGAARILKSLMTTPTKGSLMECAMKREMIMEVLGHDQEVLSRVDPVIVVDMNASQKQAIATILSPEFTKGFLGNLLESNLARAW